MTREFRQVVHDHAIGDEAEVHVVAVRAQGRVKADGRSDGGNGVDADERRTVQVNLFTNARDVGDHKVCKRGRDAFAVAPPTRSPETPSAAIA